MPNTLFYGDNLDVLRDKIKDDSVDLCYIDPPFNSKRNYNQIYNNIGTEDKAQAQAFVDTWTWDEHAEAGFQQILVNDGGRFTSQTIDLIKGLHPVLKKGSLLAYLVSMTLRVVEIHRVLKPTGSFYLHCDPTSSHYLKLVLDAIFEPTGGNFRNEIIWYYYNKMHDNRKKLFARATDNIFFYVKDGNSDFVFHQLKEMRDKPIKQLARKKVNGVLVNAKDAEGHVIYNMKEDKVMDNVWRIPCLQPAASERLGYPTQKPEALLERIIQASTNPGDTVLDAYCGCGTTVAVADRLERKWIGIDITYQAIAVILKRLAESRKITAKELLQTITLDGIPKDMASAKALALKQDDRTRKEFEKWAVLTYSNNLAVINNKKGADAGIDGIAYIKTGSDSNAKAVFQVKSGKVQRDDISTLNSDRQREGAEMAYFITLQPETKPMRDEAMQIGTFFNPLMQQSYPRVQIVQVKDIVEHDARMKVPLVHEVLKTAQTAAVSAVHAPLDFTDPDA